MIESKRTLINNRYHQLKIYGCPKEIISFAAQQASEYVTIENFMHYGRSEAEFRFQLISKEISITPQLKKFTVDFAISRKDFLHLMPLWDEEGCYALFHNITPLKLTASDLPEEQRYKALSNFGWTLELSIAGAASSGWSYITSPLEKLINKVEEQLTNAS